MTETVRIVLPERSDDAFSEAMRTLVNEINERTDGEGAYGLGGPGGYSVDFETDVFVMRRFYWGDCDCGSDERSEAWWTANPHAADCYQSELKRRLDHYKEENRVEGEAFGEHADDPYSILTGGMDVRSEPIEIEGIEVGFTSIMTPRKDPAMDRYRRASDKLHAFEEKTYRALAKIYGTDPRYGAAVHCTCGVRDRAIASDDTGHRDTCALMLPNFVYKPTGFTAEWYKWIGRDNKVSGALPSIPEMLAKCIASLPPHGSSQAERT